MTATASAVEAPPRTRVVRRDIALLRVVAIVGVVFIHVSGLTTNQQGLRGTAVWWVAEVMNAGSRFCVPLFVMVSGALLLRPGTREPLAAFYRKRLDRLVPALLFWYLTYALFTQFVLDAPKRPLTVIAVALAGRTYTALYFFWLILGLYLVTPALRKVVADLEPRDVRRLALTVTAVTCAWQTTTAFIGAHSRIGVVATPTAFTYWMPYVGYFLLGAALVQRPVPRSVAPRAAAAFLVATAVNVWQASGHVPHALAWVSPVSYHGWLTAVATVSLFLLAAALLPASDARPGRLMRLVEVMGGLTLGVFVMHLLVLYGLQHAGVLTVTKGASRLLELGYLSAATIVLTFAAAWVVSHVPGARRLV